jgi:Trk-type K+ transport system membrane component
MMYISVYPVVITIRHSNVYEERSLGIYSGDEPSEADQSDPELAAGGTGPKLESYPTDGVRSLASPLMRRLSRSTAAVDIGSILRHTFTMNGVGVPPPMPARQSNNSKLDNFLHPGRLAGAGNPNSRISFISQQIHGQLAHDIWWLVLAVLIIATIETSHYMADPVTFSVFNIIFEVVSAYGTVGISVGVPNDAFSFSGAWYTGSKLVLCLVMLRGRHRGLPVALDHAVRLPGEHLHREEEEDHLIRRSMTTRRADLED